MKTILFPFLLLSLFTVSCSSSSKKTTKLTFNNGDLLYTDSITETQAKELGNYLVKKGFFDGKEKTVQLSRENGIVHFAMILNDSLINSEVYQNKGVGLVSELEQNVFKGSTVEVDYCDEYMKVKKNIKGVLTATADTNTDTTPAVSVAKPGDPSVFEFLNGYWTCTDLSGGDVDAAEQARDLEILRENFVFNFSDDGTFTSQFINQSNLSTPLLVKGVFAVTNNQIDFTDLEINGKAAPGQKMSFEINMPNTEEMQLISKTPGKEALVMSFEHQQ